VYDRYNLGDGALGLPPGINVCYPGEACPYPVTTPLCMKGEEGNPGRYTANSNFCGGAPNSLNPDYGGCARMVCNGFAAIKANELLAPAGWRLRTKADGEILQYGGESDIRCTWCGGHPTADSSMACCRGDLYIGYSSYGGTAYISSSPQWNYYFYGTTLATTQNSNPTEAPPSTGDISFWTGMKSLCFVSDL